MAKRSSIASSTGSVEDAERDPLLGKDEGKDGETSGKGVEWTVGTHKFRISVQSLGEPVGQRAGKGVDSTEACNVNNVVRSLAGTRIVLNLHMLLIGLVVTLALLSVLMGTLAEAFNFGQKVSLRDRYNCHRYPGVPIIVFGILGSVFVVLALVLATLAGYWVSFSTSDATVTKDAKFSSLEIIAGRTQRKAILPLLRSRIDLILRDCSTVCFSMIFCLIAFYNFLSGIQVRQINAGAERCSVTVSPLVYLGAATCAFISSSISLIFYLQMCDNAKAVADEAILIEAAVEEGLAKGVNVRENYTYVDV